MGRGLHYNIRKEKSYILTMTVVDWIDLFTRVNQKQLLIDSLKFCQENKGLNIFGWCFPQDAVRMPSHLHLIGNTNEPFHLAEVIRDFKKNTSKALIEQISIEPESRREWLLERFKFAAKIHPKNKDFKVWRDKNHAIELYTERVTWQKLNYIHRNPVVDKIVYQEQDYLFSSARNHYDLQAVLDITCLTPPVITSSNNKFFNP